MPGFVEIIIRTFTAFILVWIFVHQLGKQMISQKTYHLYVASITLGTIAGNLAFNTKIKFQYFILSFVIMAAIVYFLNILAVNNRHYQKWIAGDPTVLIDKGQVLEETMGKVGYSFDSLKQALRGKDIFNIEEVERAILEVDGSMSVLKKTEYQNPTKRDFNFGSSLNRIPIELVIDGKVKCKNLSQHTYDEEWLMDELKKRNLQVCDISYAVVATNGGLYITLFEKGAP